MEQREAQQPKLLAKWFHLINPQLGGKYLVGLIQDGWFIDSAAPLNGGIFYILLKANQEEDEPWM